MVKEFSESGRSFFGGPNDCFPYLAPPNFGMCGRKFVNFWRYLTLDLGNENIYPPWKRTNINWKIMVGRWNVLLKWPLFRGHDHFFGVVRVSVLFFIGVFVNLRVQTHVHSNTQVGNLYVQCFDIGLYLHACVKIVLHYNSLYTVVFLPTLGGSCQLPSEYGTWM